jgi:hypothetical protein
MDVSYSVLCDRVEGIDEVYGVEQHQNINEVDDLKGCNFTYNKNVKGVNELDNIEQYQNINEVDDLKGDLKCDLNDKEEILLGSKTADDFLKNVEDWNETFNYGLSEFEQFSIDEFKQNINKYNNITIHSDEDNETNYKYYLFESNTKGTFSHSYSFRVFIILFESYNTQLININNTIMPLYDFINITHMTEEVKTNEIGVHELRVMPFIGNTIKCFNEWTQKQFSIQNVSIPILMRAVSYFQQLEKDKDKELDKDQLVNDVIVNEYINHEKNNHIGILKRMYYILKWALW